ncbi:MAG: late competence development ComFB family protein [Clostridiales bacterium]|mgnify:FL=1|nr:late competence development ComFB family protein [Clostridiales bacterium]
MYCVKNYMEDVVDLKIDAIIKSIDICNCDKCRLDIKAITLNSLPPRYVVTNKGILYSKLKELEVQFEVDVQKEIVKAAMIVKDNPRHEESEE